MPGQPERGCLVGPSPSAWPGTVCPSARCLVARLAVGPAAWQPGWPSASSPSQDGPCGQSGGSEPASRPQAPWRTIGRHAPGTWVVRWCRDGQRRRDDGQPWHRADSAGATMVNATVSWAHIARLSGLVVNLVGSWVLKTLGERIDGQEHALLGMHASGLGELASREVGHVPTDQLN